MEVTPEEARFLHRFVRRTVLPWIAGVGALAALALGVALSSSSPIAPIAAGTAAPGEEHEAARDELRQELASLREELAALRASAGRAARPGDGQAGRIRDELEPRLAKLEAAFAKPAPRVAGQASGRAESSPGDLVTIRDRLYNLESRQERQEKERAALQQDVLARLYDLERSTQSEAAARIDNLQTSEQRVARLELRLSQLEGRSSAPASPEPSASPR
jgi:hypothetical protein